MNLDDKKKYNKKYYEINKEILSEKRKKYKKENRDKIWIVNNEWNNSEYGFIMNLYTSAKKESKIGRHGKNILIPFEFTKESWWQHWLNQKVIDVHNEMMNRWMTKLNFKNKLEKTDITKLTENGTSFLSQELNKLRESIGEEGMKQFYQVAFEQSRKERMKNET